MHVRDRGMMAASDESILQLAMKEERVIVSEDSDFAALLARHRLAAPSLVLIRSAEPLQIEQQVTLLLNNLPGISNELEEGCVISMGRGKVRIYPLPM